MTAPLSSFREALSARPVRDTLSLHPWDSLSDPRLPFDTVAGRWLRRSRTTYVGLSPVSDPQRQRQCPAPAASLVQLPSPMRILRPGPHTPLTFPHVTAPTKSTVTSSLLSVGSVARSI
ncbi:hypothetical protein MRX96_045439 [Rhipicephalus microplus]